MNLSPTQLSILALQTLALVLNLYAIFISNAADSNRHWINVVLVLAMMYLTIKSAKESSMKNRRVQ